MDWNRDQIKQRLLVVCGGVAFFCALQDLPAVAGALRWVLGILSPFLAGGAIAFILNVPMRAVETCLPKGKRWKPFRRPLALILTLAAVSGVVTLAACVISPGVGDAVRSITGQLPAAIQRVLDAHRAIVGDRDVLDGGTRGSLGDVHVNLIYFDKDGKFHYRYYDIYIEDESVTQTNVYKALAALAADPVIQEASVFGDVTNNAEEVRLTGGYVEGLYDTETRGFVSTDLTKEQAQALEAAVRRDIEAGRFGRTLFMLDYNEYIDSVYRFSIQIHYTVTREYRDGSTRTNSDNVYLTPSVYCTETIKALEQAGVITDSRRPLTRRQYDENRRYDDEGEWWDYEKYGADAEIYA